MAYQLLRPEELGFAGFGSFGLIGRSGWEGAGVTRGLGQAVRVAILVRLWANTPCPIQVRAPSVVSIMVRSQP